MRDYLLNRGGDDGEVGVFGGLEGVVGIARGVAGEDPSPGKRKRRQRREAVSTARLWEVKRAELPAPSANCWQKNAGVKKEAETQLLPPRAGLHC